ncbi:hypothetical protein BYT27DRAFT_7258449 [Phlegmacium glaucopus]|nr:hypothetical protein BYT27DRAFT_7258449 [Phlegmacium glaucopus]
MDPERVPPRPQSEITSSAHGISEDNSGTVQADPFNPSSHSNVPRATVRIDSSNLSPSAGHLLSATNSEKSEVHETSSLHHQSNINDFRSQPIQRPLSVRLAHSNSGRREARINIDNPNPMTQIPHGIDWIVPTEEKRGVPLTVGERLQPTIDIAIIERDRYATKAKWTGYALNIAIGLQVLLGSLTTGLSASAISGGKSTATATTALGALATLVASYLARARGSNEPELSITRNKDLDQFIRECQSFKLDHGHVLGTEFDDVLIGFRRRFEELLGNANGERRLSSA